MQRSLQSNQHVTTQHFARGALVDISAKVIAVSAGQFLAVLTECRALSCPYSA